jgi:hypothetical protein
MTHDNLHDTITDRSLPRTRACAGADRIGAGSGANTTKTEVAANLSFSLQGSSLAEQGGSKNEPTLEALKQIAVELQEQNNDLAQDRDLADREVRRLRKEVALVRRELLEAQEADPKSKEIREVLDYWIDRIGKKRAAQTKTPAGGERWLKVRARLRDKFTVADLKLAIDGAMTMPFVGPHGRTAEHAPGCNRHDDISLICRDEVIVQRMIGYAKPKADEVPQLRLVSTPAESSDLLTRVLDLLPHAFEPNGSGGFQTKCPACEKDTTSLSVWTQGNQDGEMVRMSCFNGCTVDQVTEKLGIGIGDLVELSTASPQQPPRTRPLPPHLIKAMQDLLRWNVRSAA